MIKVGKKLYLIAMICIGGIYSPANAQSRLEDGFQDMFVTAGYSAAAGAAIGAAAVTLQDNPSKHLKFISIGASVGFLGGLLFGGWVALAPVLGDAPTPPDFQVVTKNTPKVIIRPCLGGSDFSLTGIEAGVVLSRF